MRFDLKEFRKAITTVRRTCPNTGSMPILSMIRLARSGERVVTISTTDLEVATQLKLEAEFPEDGIGAEDIVVAARPLAVFLKNAYGGVVRFLDPVKEGMVRILADSGSIVTPMLPGEDFPAFPGDPEEWSNVPIEALRVAIGIVLPSACHDPTKYNLNGVMIENCSPERLRMVATDGHRLAVGIVPEGRIHELGERRLTVPTRFWDALKPLIRQATGHLLVGVQGGNLTTKYGPVTLTVRCIESEFPAWKQVIPDLSGHTVTVARKQLLSVVEALAQSLDRKRPCAIMELTEDELVFHGGDSEGSVTAGLPADVAEELRGLEIGFNTKYLADAVRNLVGVDVTLQFGKVEKRKELRSAPLVFTAAGCPGMTVVMPSKMD